MTVNFDEEVASLPTSIHASEADDRIPRFGDYFLKVFESNWLAYPRLTSFDLKLRISAVVDEVD